MEKAHADKLDLLPCQRDLPNNLHDEFNQFNELSGTTLLDLVRLGIHCENPTEVFMSFRAELNLVTKFPVLIAVDDINCLHGPTAFVKPMDFHKQKFTPVHSNEILVFRALNNVTSANLVPHSFPFPFSFLSPLLFLP